MSVGFKAVCVFCIIHTLSYDFCAAKGSSSSSSNKKCGYSYFSNHPFHGYATRRKEIKRFEEWFQPQASVKKKGNHSSNYYQMSRTFSETFEQPVCNITQYYGTNTTEGSVMFFWICDVSEVCCQRDCCIDEMYTRLRVVYEGESYKCSNCNGWTLWKVFIIILAFICVFIGVVVVLAVLGYVYDRLCSPSEVDTIREPKMVMEMQEDANKKHEEPVESPPQQKEIEERKPTEQLEPPAYEEAIGATN